MNLPANALGLQLYRIKGKPPVERLSACEEVYFPEGRAAVDTILRRAAICGRVEIEGEIANHYADVLIDHDGGWETTVALDANSYRYLKRALRCRITSEDR